MRALKSLLLVCLLAACWQQAEDEDAGEVPVRGLKTVTVAASEDSLLRRFPSVLQPSELTALSFDSPGKLGALDLAVGQTVKAGEVIAALDDTELRLQIASAQAAVEQARVTAQNAKEALQRADELFSSGTITKVARDNAQTEAVAQQQLLVQAERSLDSAQEQLADANLLAPFDGTIASVDSQSFATVAAGAPIATIYREGVFEAGFTVNFATVSQLVVGTPARLILADDPSRALPGVVAELGARAETVSSFPVVVAAKDVPEIVKAGMAVEVQLEFPLPASIGYAIPLSAAVIEGRSPADLRAGAGGSTGAGPGPGTPVGISVFVFDPETETVEKRQVKMAGVRENKLLIVEGLEPGERVASAGVSFLSDGMRAKLIE